MYTTMGSRPPDPLNISAPPRDDGDIDAALAELDAKVSAWAEALRGAHVVLQRQVADVAAAPDSYYEEEPERTPPARSPRAASGSHVRSDQRAGGEPAGQPPAEADPWAAAQFEANADGEMDFLSMSWPGSVSTAEQSEAENEPDSPAPRAGQAGAPRASQAHGRRAPRPRERVAPAAPSAVRQSPSRVTVAPRANPADSVEDGAVDGEAIEAAAQPAAADAAAAQRNAREESEELLLAAMDEEVVKRVRIARRFDPTADLKELIEKTQAKAAPDKTEKPTWWRRKKK